jgi:hypothetical protein
VHIFVSIGLQTKAREGYNRVFQARLYQQDTCASFRFLERIYGHVFWFLIVIAYLISGRKRKRKENVNKRKTDYQPPKHESYDRAPEVVREQSVAERQLVTVRSNEFFKRTLMNKSEYGVFYRLEKLLSASHRGYRVFSQVSLGEILGSDDKQAYLAD